MIHRNQLTAACETLLADLMAWRTASGHWVGRLSASALSTATAVSALALVDRHAPDGPRHAELIDRAVNWLVQCVNDDGGWGDTDRCRSNLATTMLVRAAFHLAGAAEANLALMRRAGEYIECEGHIAGLRRRYGRDKTFAVPILTNCALAGLVSWSKVAPLPFELACLPHAALRFLRLPVVSYALPALVAIGQARYFHAPPRNPVARAARRLAVEPSLKKLHAMQPASGGYLEATPLTSFVVMSLAATGRVEHPVVRDGVRFLVDSVRDEGSWPIDTNLATWVTALAVNSLPDELLASEGDSPLFAAATSAGHGDVFSADKKGTVPSAGKETVPRVDRGGLVDWLLACQHRTIHPFTQAAAGGWGWTDLAGAVPDADDTAGALLALARLANTQEDCPLDGDCPRVAPTILRQQDSSGSRRCRRIVGVAQQQEADALGDSTPLVASRHRRFRGHAVSKWLHLLRGIVGATRHDDDSLADKKGTVPGAVRDGVGWLLNLQNADGGWPTFCRGWGALPLDRSGADLTAHALRAIHTWRHVAPRQTEKAIDRGFAYLARTQRDDGAWIPLWFGNERDPREENPVYGTARVLLAYRDLDRLGAEPARRAVAWICAHQNSDGGWGGDLADVSTVEETAVATEALLAAIQTPTAQVSADQGLAWLVRAVAENRHQTPSPIGLYFARLWYYEAMYPIVFALSALERGIRRQGAGVRD